MKIVFFCSLCKFEVVFTSLSVQEKEDLEAQFRDVNEKSERALLQQSALQEELERTRQQANETLKVMDIERQQLRGANNKYRV